MTAQADAEFTEEARQIVGEMLESGMRKLQLLERRIEEKSD